MVKAGDVGRQQGVVVVQVAESLRAEALKTSGLLQVDADELPGNLRGARWAFSYRYASVPYELTLGIEKVQPQITVDSLVEAVAAARPADARSDGDLHDREGGRLPLGIGRSGRLRRAARPRGERRRGHARRGR